MDFKSISSFSLDRSCLNAKDSTILLNGGLQVNHLVINGILACSKHGRGERSEHDISPSETKGFWGAQKWNISDILTDSPLPFLT